MMNMQLKGQCELALNMLYNSIIELLKSHESGLSNSEITHSLGLESSQNGKQKDYLAYGLLGNLMNAGKIKKSGRLYVLIK
jgi:hypothetical protein